MVNYSCYYCKVASTEGEWNDKTDEEYDGNYEPLGELVDMSQYGYTCPVCGMDNDGTDMLRGGE